MAREPAPPRDGDASILVTVVVPVLDSIDHLPRTTDALLRALRRMESGEWEMIFVDNGSTDGSLEFLESRLPAEASVLELPGATVGAVRNYGAARARGRYISFLDADCAVTEDYFERALQVVRETGADATGSLVALPSEPHWVERNWIELHAFREDGWVRSLNSGNFFCRRAAFEDVGGFDPDLETGEDWELCQRLVSKGYRIYRATAVRAIHLDNPKSIGGFFAKQRWRGLGALGTVRRDPLDKPFLGTLAHLAALIAGAGIVLHDPSWRAVWIAGALGLVTPVAAVVYRLVEVGRPVNPAAAVCLYWLYFAGRGVALIEMAAKRLLGLLPGHRRPAARSENAARS